MTMPTSITLPHTGRARRFQGVAMRRLTMAALVLNTIGVLLTCMVTMMSHRGITPLEATMLVAFVVTLPWLAIGFWNAVVGFAIARLATDPASVVTPQLARVRGSEPIETRTAVVMAIRNEDPRAAIGRIAAIQAGMDATMWSGHFDYFVLSDTDDMHIAEMEERRVAEWQAQAPQARITYRRRDDNWGYKAGNVGAFVRKHHQEYDFFLPLDADSAMGASAILRLVRTMQANPTMGMLQGLVVGTPSSVFYTRAFQYGMRHAMRAFTLGSAWWQADCGPSWGHNILIRMRPFHDNCLLEPIAGTGPLRGHILSHDQVEAVLMRRSGYECRVLAAEDESFEDNPPSLTDAIKRELRWCNGNFQYVHLIGMRGLRPLSRLQLGLCILMYAAPIAWMAFVVMGTILAIKGEQLMAIPLWQGITFFAVIMVLNLMPKIMGTGQILASGAASRRYGGRLRVLAGGIVETVLSIFTAPVIALAITIGALRLALGYRISWSTQTRDRNHLGWNDALRALWPQTLIGVVLMGTLIVYAPWAMWFAIPILGALVLAVPIAVVSAMPSLGAWSQRVGLFALPEERMTEAEPRQDPALRPAA